MSSLLIDNIGLLVTEDGERQNAAVVVDGERIAWIGEHAAAPAVDEHVDAEAGCVIPGFVDSHAHLMFAGDRTAEFEARMSGQRYAAGGIRSTVAATRAASDRELLANAERLAAEMLAGGITTLEIKSGYGLSTIDEARSLALARELTPETTYLGAHVVPADYADDPAGYVELVTGPMLDAAVPHANWIDVFCETGAFDVDQARAILTAGRDRGLGMRMHAGQLGESGGVHLAVELGAASVDHCTFLSSEDVDALAAGSTVATLLPGAEFSTRQPYPDARRLLDAGVTVALATDCNPGSSFTTSMSFCIAVAVREMGMTPAEALRAATVGGAAALRLETSGSIAVGMYADLAILAAPSYVHLAYRPGVPLVSRTLKHGALSLHLR
jgi:imidazolonepropionase